MNEEAGHLPDTALNPETVDTGNTGDIEDLGPLAHLTTEAADDRFSGIDRMSVGELARAIIAGGSAAFVSAVEGAEDDVEAGAAAMDEAAIGPLDTVVGIASSGRTPYVVTAARRSRELGALTVGFSCNRATALSAVSEHPVEVLVGPEVVSGSTRLKAGTAQKMVLNMISTIVMVRLGKTYGNLMVDVRVTNEKLRARAIRMIISITGASRELAIGALEETDYCVKPAVIRLLTGVTAAQAQALLDDAHGRLQTVLAADENSHPRRAADRPADSQPGGQVSRPSVSKEGLP